MVYTRRKFLSTLVVSASAVALGGIAGCGSSSSKDQVVVPTPLPQPKPTGLQPGQVYFPQSLLSGDPKPSSVILWTRVEDADAGDISVQLQVALDADFTDIRVDETLTAYSDSDHCLKVRVTDLDPYSHYYYRFVYTKDEVQYVTNIGRTKTAPLNDADVPVNFAFVSCQDYIGRYYNSYLSVLDNDDLDFIVHLGDYVYETTGDASFQSTDGRGFEFDDLAGAQQLGQGDANFYAAKSLSNYRQLYKTYRGDSVLQEVHEKFPMIAIWDDHEFADDSWQDTATSLSGIASEQDLTRKKDSERVYFEYMPIDHEHANDKALSLGQGELAISEDHLFPNTKIYRDFKFGQHVHLLMSDFRTHRPDHLIPEDGFPGTIVMDQAITAMVIAGATGYPIEVATGIVKAKFMSYIDIDLPQFHIVKTVLLDVIAGLYKSDFMTKLNLSEADAGAKGLAKATGVLSGNLAIDYLNEVIKQIPQSLLDIYGVEAFEDTDLEKGIAYFTMGKTSLFSELGSRYMVVKDVFDLYAGYKASVNPASQNAYGDAQMAWLGGSVMTSTATWKILGSSVSFAPIIFDLSSDRMSTGIAPLEAMLDSDAVPALFKNRFYVNVDHWDGFPQAKQKIINELLSPAGVITLSGDVHSSYVTEHAISPLTGKRSFGFTAASVSSGTLGSFIDTALSGLAASVAPESAETFKALNPFFNALTASASTRADVATKLTMSELWKHGVGIVRASGDQLNVELHQVPAVGDVEYVKDSFYDDRATFLAAVEVSHFTVKDGELTAL